MLTDDMSASQAWTIDFWLRAGAPKEKLIVGIPTYGMSFTLENPAKHDMRAPATGGGKRGQYTQEEGTLAYYEVGGGGLFDRLMFTKIM